jgi:hypothetical protein
MGVLDVAKNPWEFLEGWARENVHATVYDDMGTGFTRHAASLASF